MNILYETACGHLAARSPENVKLDQHFSCRACNLETYITGVQISEYRAKCTQCNWSRYTGMAKFMAEHAAGRHALRKTHAVSVDYAANPAAVKERTRIENGRLL